MKYQEIECKSALNQLKRGRLPYHWDLNIYRGCTHQCQYCYAIYSQKYLNNSDFYHTIYIKKNIVSVLEKKLASKHWKREVINVGGITDSYQPIEKEMKLMRAILKLMIQYKNPIIISTKSDLILRDIDLINELSKVATVNIAATITTLDEDIRSHIEKGAVSSERRFSMLQQIKEKTNAVVGVHMMPIIPYLTDSYDNLEQIFIKSRDINVDYLLPGTLYLRGDTKPVFLDFIKEEYPHLYPTIINLYKQGSLNKEYKTTIYKKLNDIKSKYPINYNYQKVLKEKSKQFNYLAYKQLSLFDE